MTDLVDTYLLHWSPPKAIWIAGSTLSWDARCAGIYAGFAVGVLFHFFRAARSNRLPPSPLLAAAMLLAVPLFADVSSIALGLREASNDWRFATGILFGQALSAFVFPALVTLSGKAAGGRAALAGAASFAAFLLIALAVFLAKSVPLYAAYVLLESLAVFGCASLVCMLGAGVALSLAAGSFPDQSHGRESGIGSR